MESIFIRANFGSVDEINILDEVCGEFISGQEEK